MKHGRYILGCILLIMCIGMCVYFVKTGDNKCTPAQRYNETVAKDNTQTEQKEDAKQNEKEADIQLNGKFDVKILEYCVLNADEVAVQSKYNKKDFYEEKLPEGEETEEITDYEAAGKVCPELKELWNNPEQYSADEAKNIYDRHLDVIEKYTSTKIIPQKYVFVTCEVKNVSKESDAVGLAELDFISTSKDFSVWSERTDNAIYFDQAEYTEGDDRLKSFFWRNMDGGEKIICTLGFEVEDFGNDAQYYIGSIDQTMYETGENLATGKKMFKLEDLVEKEEKQDE